MLVRANPKNETISLLSFPRDLRAEIVCPGEATYTTKINAAYAACGSRGTLETVRKLTGVPINYLITVNFRGFTQVVDKLGGMWMDVDRRYLNTRSGQYGYATINLQPGYQRLNGYQALDFVRFRHTDSDLHRNARQQLFVRALKDQVRTDFSLTKLPKMIKVLTSNIEVGAGRRQERQRQDGALVRRPRVLAAAGSRVPVEDRGARGLLRPDDVLREHLGGGSSVGESRRRVAEEGHRGGARREGQGEGSSSEGDDRDGAERQRRHGLRVERELPARAARLPDPDAAERHSRERTELHVLPHDRLLRSEAEGSEAGRAEGREPVRLGRRREERRLRSAHSRTTRC